jgi:hypothetical protein
MSSPKTKKPLTPKLKKRPRTVREAEVQGLKKATTKQRKKARREGAGLEENGTRNLKFKSCNRKAEPQDIPRRSSILFCFLSLWTVPWMVLNLSYHNSIELDRCDPDISLSLYVEFISTKLWILSQPKRARLSDFFPLQIPFIRKPMGWNRFNNLNSHCWVVPHYYPYLSANFLRCWSYGEAVVLDEKLKKRRGRSPCIRKVPEKKAKVGHWTTQICSIASQTQLPYCTSIWPFLGKGQGSNPKCSDIIKWAVKPIETLQNPPVLVCDPYYLDTEGRAYLQERDIPYHCSVNVSRFDYIFETTKVRVKGIGQWDALYSSSTNEFAASVWDVDVGKRYLLSTALEVSGNYKKKPKSPPGWYAYKHLFDACDKMNVELTKIFWPYKQKFWQNDFDDMFLSTSLFNAYVLFRESNTNKKNQVKRILKVILTVKSRI